MGPQDHGSNSQKVRKVPDLIIITKNVKFEFEKNRKKSKTQVGFEPGQSSSQLSIVTPASHCRRRGHTNLSIYTHRNIQWISTL